MTLTSLNRVCEQLASDGVAVTSFSELVGDEQLWGELSRDIQAYAETASRTAAEHQGPIKAKKHFILSSVRQEGREGGVRA